MGENQQICDADQEEPVDGDEEMKKTIAKAWTDARSGKAADPLKGQWSSCDQYNRSLVRLL